MIERTCPNCLVIYLADESRLKHGRQTTCSRKCSYELRAINHRKPDDLKFDQKAYNKQYYLEHSESIIANVRKWQTKDNPKFVSWGKNYRARTKANAAERSKRWYVVNREVAVERAKAWKKLHPDSVRANTRDYATRRSGADGMFSSRDYLKLLRRYQGLCAYCGLRPANSIDHVTPLSRGGTNYIGNILPACSFCNSSKGAKTLVSWRNS